MTEISRVFRGFVEREIHRRRREKHYHFTRTVPCSILVQARYRGYVARRNIAQRKIEWLAGLKIQLQVSLSEYVPATSVSKARTITVY